MVLASPAMLFWALLSLEVSCQDMQDIGIGISTNVLASKH
jgi:hypothetical protein